jgi:hypothetical protein
MLEGSDPVVSNQEIVMRRSSIPLVMFLAVSAYVYGQVLEPHSPEPEVVRPIATTFQSNVSTADGCPVGLFVDRRSNLVTRLAEDGHPAGPAQGLHISLIHLFSRIESAEIAVYGVTSRASIVPLGGTASNEVSKTFVLHPGMVSQESQEATVWMRDVGALTRVELKSLTYADGSGWRESEGSKCRAVPSLFVLVGTK